MSGDYQARFCEGLGVKLPRSTLRRPKANKAEESQPKPETEVESETDIELESELKLDFEREPIGC